MRTSKRKVGGGPNGQPESPVPKRGRPGRPAGVNSPRAANRSKIPVKSPKGRGKAKVVLKNTVTIPVSVPEEGEPQSQFGENNSAQIALPQPQTSKAGRRRSSNWDCDKQEKMSQANDGVNYDEDDHVRVDLHDSENEYFQLDDSLQDQSYNKGSDCESDGPQDNRSEDSGSEVVILRPNPDDLRRQREEEIRALTDDPIMQEVLQDMVEQRVQDALNSRWANAPAPVTLARKKAVAGEYTRKVVSKIKSPSDTTIYAPALKLTPDKNVSNQVVDKVMDQSKEIADFLQDMRIQAQDDMHCIPEEPMPEPDRYNGDNQQPGTSGEGCGGGSRDRDLEWKRRARETANRLTVQSEQLMTRLDAPQGKVPMVRYSDVVDDKFFHITCHVDANLRTRIESGQFVELDKLLVRERPFSRNDNRMALYTKNGLTYFAPTEEKDLKINNVRKWEQAFWVYATLYSKANPHRASEIWQYVHVINHASHTYQWSNIAEYDYTFRHLMAEHPERSWGKTYLQGWNLIMRDTIPKEGHSNTNGNKGFSFSRDNICWPFNKGKCVDPNCPKEHKCGYCGKWGHGVFNCRKKKRNMGRSDRGHEQPAQGSVKN